MAEEWLKRGGNARRWAAEVGLEARGPDGDR